MRVRMKVNSLCFMDDLNPITKTKKICEYLTATVQMINKDIDVEFGIKKCGVMILKKRENQ